MTFLLRIFSGLKGYLFAIGAAILSVAGIYLAGRKSGKDAVRIKATKQARETERKATKALTGGLQREADALAAARARRRVRERTGKS